LEALAMLSLGVEFAALEHFTEGVYKASGLDAVFSQEKRQSQALSGSQDQ
jgi:hypothetical protein